MKMTIGIILGMVVGFLGHLLLPKKPETDRHWQVVRNYNAFVSNSSNYRRDAATGFLVSKPPGDPLLSLAALVAAGELSHVDLVLPSVPYNGDVARYWMTFAQNHKEIIYILGNPSYFVFQPSGKQPLHLNIWYRDADQAVVQTLIRGLEEFAQDGGQKDGANGSQPIRSETNQTSSAAASRR